MIQANPLIHFKSLGTSLNYVFQGNSGELFQVACDQTFGKLMRLYAGLSDSPVPIHELQRLASDMGIEVDTLRSLLLSDDLPPILENEYEDPRFLESIQGHQRLFFVFPSYDCNLNCAYCTYSGLYPKERDHQPVKMDDQAAQSCIGIILENSCKVSGANVVFYGDEPLINFPAITTIVEGLQAANNRFSFQIVTNGLLLDDEIARYCLKHRIKLQLSVDGPPDIHDRYRRTRGGRATHAKVMGALQRLHTLDPDYFATMTGIGCTLAPPFDLERVDQWFREQPLFGSHNGKTGNFSVSVMNLTGPHTEGKRHPAYLPGDQEAYNAQARRMFERFSDALLTGEEESVRFLPTALFEAAFHRFVSRCTETDGHPRRWRHTGECLPGAGGLAIGADGKLYVCSSLNLRPIGDTSQGLSLQTLSNQRSHYLEVRNGPCRQCWVNRFCPLCPAAFKYADDRYLDTLDCASVRELTDNFLTLYIKATTQTPQRLKQFLRFANGH
ncbi:MAG: radical SAM protein [Candidatus Methylumidiphilus sp.]